MFKARFHNLARETLRNLHCFGHRTSFSEKVGNVRTGPRIASFFQCFHAHTDCDFFHFGEMHLAFPDSPPAFNLSVLFSALQGSIKADVLEVDGLSIDAALGRGDPASHFAALEDTVHQAVHKGAVV